MFTEQCMRSQLFVLPLIIKENLPAEGINKHTVELPIEQMMITILNVEEALHI
jgi:hypothetical protein